MSKFLEIQAAVLNYTVNAGSSEKIAQAMGIHELTQDSILRLKELYEDIIELDDDDVERSDELIREAAWDIIQMESSKIIANCEQPSFEFCLLERSGSNQFYYFTDENGFSINPTGDIFDFGSHYRASDHVYFHHDGAGVFTPIDWFEIPMWSEPDEEKAQFRKECIFVFDTIVTSNCEVVRLYDYFS